MDDFPYSSKGELKMIKVLDTVRLSLVIIPLGSVTRKCDIDILAVSL